MSKRTIHLTESQLHQMIREAVKQVTRFTPYTKEQGEANRRAILGDERSPEERNPAYARAKAEAERRKLQSNKVDKAVRKTMDEVISEKSGIEIKPENKGKFTATQKRTGKSTEELTHSKNPLTRKRANFARMAKRGWKPLKETEDCMGESKKKVVKNDDGKVVPEKCPKCGAKVGTFIQGEPIYKCTNKDCGEFFGVVPFPSKKM